MTQIKLKKDAPWPKIAMPCGYTLSKTEWTNYEEVPGIAGVKHYLDYKDVPDLEPVIPTIVDTTVKEKVDYSSMTKAQLVEIAQSKGIDISGLTKAKLVEVLSA